MFAKLLIDAAKDSKCDLLKLVKGLVGVLGGYGDAILGTSIAAALVVTFPVLAPASVPLGLGLNILCGTMASEGGKKLIELVA